MRCLVLTSTTMEPSLVLTGGTVGPGMNASAAGLVVAAVFNLYDRARLSSPFPEASVGIGIAAFVAVAVTGVPAPVAIVAAGLLGVVRATCLHQ